MKTYSFSNPNVDTKYLKAANNFCYLNFILIFLNVQFFLCSFVFINR